MPKSSKKSALSPKPGGASRPLTKKSTRFWSFLPFLLKVFPLALILVLAPSLLDPVWSYWNGLVGAGAGLLTGYALLLSLTCGFPIFLAMREKKKRPNRKVAWLSWVAFFNLLFLLVLWLVGVDFTARVKSHAVWPVAEVLGRDHTVVVFSKDWLGLKSGEAPPAGLETSPELDKEVLLEASQVVTYDDPERLKQLLDDYPDLAYYWKDPRINWLVQNSLGLGKRDTLKVLRRRGYPFDSGPKGGPLHYAVTTAQNRGQSVKLLVELGATVTAVDGEGNTPLHALAQTENFKSAVADFLLVQGADIEARNNAGDTPLHSAVREGRESATAYLLARGADPDIENKAGKTPAALLTELPAQSHSGNFSKERRETLRKYLDAPDDVPAVDPLELPTDWTEAVWNRRLGYTLPPETAEAPSKVTEEAKPQNTPTPEDVEIAKPLVRPSPLAPTKPETDLKGVSKLAISDPLQRGSESNKVSLHQPKIRVVFRNDREGKTKYQVAIAHRWLPGIKFERAVTAIKGEVSETFEIPPDGWKKGGYQVTVTTTDGQAKRRFWVVDPKGREGNLKSVRVEPRLPVGTTKVPVKLRFEDTPKASVSYRVLAHKVPGFKQGQVVHSGEFSENEANEFEEKVALPADSPSGEYVFEVEHEGLKKSADFAIRDATALNQEESRFVGAVKRNEIDKIRSMAQSNPDLVRLVGPGGYTPLHLAAQEGSLESAKVLVESGAEVDAPRGEVSVIGSKGELGQTPLFDALRQKQKPLTEFLLAEGASIHHTDYQGKTPIFAAVDAGDLEMTRTLLKKGAKADIRLKSGDKPTLLHRCPSRVEWIQLLFENGTPIKSPGEYERSPLLSHYEKPKVVKALLQLGADPNQHEPLRGTPPLHEMVARNALECVKLLIEYGADVNADDFNGFTALHTIAQGRVMGAALVSARELLKAGASSDVKDGNSISVEDMAKREPSGYAAKVLKEKNGEPK
jgi:ankyrin repeat protein